MRTWLFFTSFFLFTSIVYAKEISALVWPQAPDPARIAFERLISQPEDLGVKKGFFLLLGEFLFGSDPISLSAPFGIHVDSKKLYITDIGSKKLYVFNKKEYDVLHIEGSPDESFAYPIDVVSDSQGMIYVSDSVLAKIFVFRSNGSFSHFIKPPRSLRPVGIALSKDEKELYIVDALASTIFLTTVEGKVLRSIGRPGTKEGEFNKPTFIAIGKDSKLYISDSMNHRIQILDANGTFVRSFGQLSRNIGGFASPRGIALDSDDNIYVTDTLFNAIQLFNKNGELLMVFGDYGDEKGAFALPEDISIFSDNTIYISDTNNRRVQQFKRLDLKSKER